ncbi:MAG: AAA family ATPase [Gammaproteobacteria bacterium CG22_combo_CG10-13_8_21_14_all_40_8]|nr:MAG: AAA family ATPase [Gammaproteobacteria bacterium CG22_combo_CG10-13_8_21_14_all_40_8]
MNANNQHSVPFYLPQDKEIELFRYAHANQLPLLLKGPTGCGKTRFIEHMANELQLPLYTVACHDDLTATDLVGRHLIGAGDTIWQDGPLTRAVRNGGICYLDEVIEARKDTTVVIHPLTDDRRILPIDRTGEILHAPDNFMLVVSYNPGYQNLMKGLKPSTRQRFISLSFDYLQPELEVKVVHQETGYPIAGCQQLVQLAQALRRLKGVDLEEGASTRLLVYVARLLKDGFDPVLACKAALVEPLTDDEDTITGLMEVVKATFGD